MKELRTAQHSGDPAHTLASDLDHELTREDELLRWRRLQAQLRASEDATHADLAHDKPLAEQRSWPDRLRHHGEAPCKVTAVELAEEVAKAAPVMPPEAALAYGDWLLAEERGWHEPDPSTARPARPGALATSAAGGHVTDRVTGQATDQVTVADAVTGQITDQATSPPARSWPIAGTCSRSQV
ncbi:MAG TPA: hypothetical protein PKU97_18545, partial [Kofleriaceae bacterium]|nr:hypothetical protein [Kofleriaceae bacterium]